MSLYSKYFYSKDMDGIFSEEKIVEKMLYVEAILAQAQAKNNLIPLSVAHTIEKYCRVELISIANLKDSINNDGNIAISLIRQLSEVVQKDDAESAKYIHLGATSQDIIDTAYVLLIQEASDWLLEKINTIITQLRSITEAHKKTVMIGRTLLQHAKLITFGLKTSGWLESIWRSKRRIENLNSELSIQLAGPVGNRNEYLTDSVIEYFAHRLNLKPAFSWHTQRDRFAEWGTTLGMLSGQLGKIASDVLLLMQTEIGEVIETEDSTKGGSSSLPHKHNPVICNVILANAARIPHLVATLLSTMVQQHERSPGQWHAEWEVIESIFRLTAGSIEKYMILLNSMEINIDRMSSNLDHTHGLIYSEKIALHLAKKMGKTAAHQYVKNVCEKAQAENRHLQDILKDEDLSTSEIDAIFNPEKILGSTYQIIEAILKRTKN